MNILKLVKISGIILLFLALSFSVFSQETSYNVTGLDTENDKRLLKHKRPYKRKFHNTFVLDSFDLNVLAKSLDKLKLHDEIYCKNLKNRIYQSIGLKIKGRRFVWVNSISIRNRQKFLDQIEKNQVILISDGTCICFNVLFDIEKREFIIFQVNSIA